MDISILDVDWWEFFARDIPWWLVILATLGMTHLTIVSVTVYLHRNQTHRALDLHPAAQFLFRFWLWLTTGMQTREWVAIHRKHHACVETEEDPHSPQIVGIKNVLLRGTELYREEANNPQTLEKYGHGTTNDWWEKQLFTRFDSLGIVLMLVIDILLFGVIGLTVWAVQMAWIPIFAAGVINGAGHWCGYRNFETNDAATNLVPWGILIGGEELHNNHHAFASSARFSNKKWEFDVGWLYIRILSGLRLATVRKLSPITEFSSGNSMLDIDTLSTILGARWHVLADYGKQVLARVHKEEMSVTPGDNRKRFAQARPLIIKNEALLSEKQRASLEHVLAHSQSLAIVYEFRQRLNEIFVQRTASHENLLQQLHQWCAHAEETGITALEEFAERMGCYVLKDEKYASA